MTGGDRRRLVLAGQILAAPHTGDVVKTQPVTIPYWTSTTWSVRRYG